MAEAGAVAAVDNRSATCPTCSRTFSSYAGRRLHERRQHPVVFHDALVGEIRARPKARWDAEEDALMASFEANHPELAPGALVKALQEKILPHRTEEAIKCHRKSKAYKEVLQRLSTPSEEVQIPSPPRTRARAHGRPRRVATRARPATPEPLGGGEGEVIVEAGSESPENRVTRDLEVLVQQLSDELGVSVPVRTADIEESLDSWLPPTAPRVTPFRGNPREPSPRRLRRRRYAAFQQQWKRDRGRVVKKVLSGEDLIAAHGLPEGTHAFWRGLFQRPSPEESRDPAPLRNISPSVMGPVEEGELVEVLKATRVGTAPGPDGRKLGDLRGLGNAKLLWVFNSILWLGSLPSNWTRDTTISYLYASTADGGLGIPCLATRVPRLKEDLLQRLRNSEDPVVRAAVSDRGEAPEDAPQTPAMRKQAERTAWSRKLTESVDGAGLRGAQASPISSAWVDDGTLLLKGGDFVRAVKFRGNLMATKSRSSRGRRVEDKSCDLCHRQTETLGHILQRCPMVHIERTNRHNRVLDFAVSRLRAAGYSPSAFHGRAGDTPVRALGKRGERAKITATTYSNPHRHVRPFGSHRRISVPHPTARRLREPCGWIPDDARSLAALAFRPADGRGEPGAKRDGRAPLLGLLRAPFDAAAFTTPFTNPVPVSHRRTSGLDNKGSAARGRIWNGSPPPEWGIGTATRWAVTDGTEGKEGRRRHPTAHASLPLSPVQRPNPGPLPAQARLARSSEPILIPNYLPRMFHGKAVVRGTPQEPRRSTADRVTNTLSLCEWLLGSRRLKQKRKLFPGPPPMDASWFPVTGFLHQGTRARDGAGPLVGIQAWLRNKYRIPFRH
ncbi:hypothetical protein O3P69_011306 [Scylla paramamosain]|uniref:C2H2-type domain-containing protein n=1 Tax=Scylla paramamosain TaxID=85552 RepID=A0AAW0SFE4_SCYPA